MKNRAYIPNLFIHINNLMQRNEILRKIKVLMYFIDWFLLIFTKRPHKQEGKKKVLIMYNLALGDGAMFACVLKNIREIYPKDEYEITIACQSGLNKIYENIETIDKVIPVNFTKATVHLKERMKAIKQLRKEYYDIVIDPIGPEECSTNVLMTRVVEGKEKITVLNKDRKTFCPKFVIRNVYTKIEKIHGANIALLEHYYEFFSILANKKLEIEFCDLPSEKLEVEMPEEYFIIYPSASSDLKKWPIERFAKIAEKIAEKTKLPMVLCGTNVDKEDNDKLKELVTNVEIIDLTNKTNILQFIETIKKAKFVIANDTGIYHISIISEVPVTATSGGYTYDRYLKYGFESKYKKPYVILKKEECFNCENRCKHSEEMNGIWPCLNKISVEDAWNVIEKMIDDIEE